MINVNKDEFIKKSMLTLDKIFDVFNELDIFKLNGLEKSKTALVIIDVVNGFTREGPLKSPRVEGLIPQITQLAKACKKAEIPIIAFADCHSQDSPEFDSYPPHCVNGTNEAEIVDEIKEIGGYKLISKNSTNSFLEEEFQKWFNENNNINNYIITGDCTDICIQQFSITLKTWFNMHNKKSRIIVPINAVDTYDLDMHNGDLVHVMALYNMMINGVEIVRGVE